MSQPAFGRPLAPLPPITLVLGGGGSGKSVFAENLILNAVAPEARAAYIATAQPNDPEMAARIQRHQARRGPRWDTVLEPLELGSALARESRPDRPVLVDCLTLWLSNVMHAKRHPEAETAAMLASLEHGGGPVVFVSNEVGLGLVPETPLGREFRDEAGLLNQTMARMAAQVIFVVAGLPLVLKGESGGAR